MSAGDTRNELKGPVSHPLIYFKMAKFAVDVAKKAVRHLSFFTSMHTEFSLQPALNLAFGASVHDAKEETGTTVRPSLSHPSNSETKSQKPISLKLLQNCNLWTSATLEVQEKHHGKQDQAAFFATFVKAQRERSGLNTTSPFMSWASVKSLKVHVTYYSHVGAHPRTMGIGHFRSRICRGESKSNLFSLLT